MMTFAMFTSVETENKRTATAALLSGESQIIVLFDLQEFYGNSDRLDSQNNYVTSSNRWMKDEISYISYMSNIGICGLLSV